MSIRNLISQPTRTIRKELTHDKKTYVFQGTPDANLMADSLLLSQEKVGLLAQHWTTVCGQTVNPDVVKHVKVVHQTLQPVEGEAPYDETEVAILACKEGPLFLKMLAAAYEVLGLTEEQVKQLSPVDVIASGNSGEPVATS